MSSPARPAGGTAEMPGRFAGAMDSLVRSVGPVVLAVIACGILLAILGRDPVGFFANIVTAGVLRPSGIQDSITRMAPVILIASGLVIVFRANLWNLGTDGQFLLAAAMVAGIGPIIMKAVPAPIGWILLCVLAMAVGALWTLVPALLRARYQINEIITTLMMSFIGIGVANLLVKGPFKGPSTVPQTAVIPKPEMLPDLPGTSIHLGVFVAIGVILIVHLMLTRTSLGTRLDVLGANPRAAVHLGLDVQQLTVAAFAMSGALIGLAAAVDILGIFGYMRADWNPAYGLKVVPIVFLARLNALAIIPFAIFFSVVSIGGEYAARQASLPTDFILYLVGMILIFMVVTQYLSDLRARGGSLLPKRAKASADV
jgi:general nucleoside transport system permease protein